MDTGGEFTGPVNLGSAVEHTIIEIAKKIIQLTKSESKIIFKDLPQDDPVRRKPDLSLAKKTIDWNSSISLEQGLIKTIDYFKAVCGTNN